MNKDIRFTQKKIDDSWKDQVQREQGKAAAAPASGPSGRTPQAAPPPAAEAKPTSKPYLNFITSLGLQAMMHLGEMPNPETQTAEVNLDAAREILDLLVALKEKSEGNLSREEKQFFFSFLPELQLKFAQKV